MVIPDALGLQDEHNFIHPAAPSPLSVLPSYLVLTFFVLVLIVLRSCFLFSTIVVASQLRTDCIPIILSSLNVVIYNRIELQATHSEVLLALRA